VASLAAAIGVVLGCGTWYALTKAPAQAGVKDAAARQSLAAHTRKTPAKPITVVSVSPARATTGVNGTSPITVTFSGPLAADSPMPSVSPSVAGSWQRVSADAVEFLPTQGFTEQTHVLVNIPAGDTGVRSTAGGLLAAPVTSGFWTGSYSVMRAEELLAQLGYLPLTWAPASQAGQVPASSPSAQLSAAYDPPAGSFAWQQGYPSALVGLWAPGQTNEMLTGAVMAFESDHNLTMDGIAGPQVWAALLSAAAAGQNNTHGYTYALASQDSPETLTVWHNGQVILTSPANTGVPGATTADGTYPVYEKFVNTIMTGKNPDGTSYRDSVWYVSYFNGGDAVHYFPRASYGFPQSDGCVELPYSQAVFIYPYLTYGTLVTVTGPIP
jgi:peptidoglycan hydrolase-like protein with peptidoglycan-binding domain